MKVLSGALVVAGRLAFATRHRKPSAVSTRPPCSPFHPRTHFFPPGDFLFRGIIGTLRGSGSTQIVSRLDRQISRRFLKDQLARIYFLEDAQCLVPCIGTILLSSACSASLSLFLKLCYAILIEFILLLTLFGR